MRHTPGPWTTEFSEYGGYDCMSAAWIVKAGLEYIVDVDCNEAGHANSPQAEANAKLIATAPELLSALKMLYEETAEYIRINNLGDIHHNSSMQYARDAIAKSEAQ